MLTDLSVTPIAETIRRLSAELQERRPSGAVGQGGEDDLLRPRPARVRGEQPQEGPAGRGARCARPHHRRAVPRRVGAHEGGPEAALRGGPRRVRAHGQEGARRVRGPPGAAHRTVPLRVHGGGGLLRGAQVRDPPRLHGQPLHPPPSPRRDPLAAEPRAGARGSRKPGPHGRPRSRASLPLREEAVRGGEGDPGDGAEEGHGAAPRLGRGRARVLPSPDRVLLPRRGDPAGLGRGEGGAPAGRAHGDRHLPALRVAATARPHRAGSGPPRDPGRAGAIRAPRPPGLAEGRLERAARATS